MLLARMLSFNGILHIFPLGRRRVLPFGKETEKEEGKGRRTFCKSLPDEYAILAETSQRNIDRSFDR